MSPRGGRLSLATIVSWLAPVVVVVALWYPHVAHYYVATPQITTAAVEAARQAPDDRLLQELAAFTPGFMVAKPVFALADPVPVAERLLQGICEAPGLPAGRMKFPFAPEEVVEGGPEWELAGASLVLPALLVRAYERTGDDRYLLGARDMILGWSGFERRAWLPHGLLWNDHAVAARIPVLGQFWAAYRHHRSYDPAVGAHVLEFAARSAAFLARPDHFTPATNHGVMQNLGLLHYALAFPTLPAAGGPELAQERLREQLGFYVNDEGVILEHSIGYHRDGVELLGMALRYLALTGIPPDPVWVEKYRRSRDVYAQFRRPGGGLAPIGDTAVEPDPDGPRIVDVGLDGRVGPLALLQPWPAPRPWTVYPVAGYAIDWTGSARDRETHGSQTIVTWSYFPGHAHKHPDEMSLALWAAGQAWIGNVGYWPYEKPGFEQAASWVGSNAPHVLGEGPASARSTRLHSATRSDGMSVIDLERTGPGGYRARRQIVHLVPDLWIVVDHARVEPGRVSQVLWGLGAGLQLREAGPPALYRIEPEAGRPSMLLGVASSPGTRIHKVRGSLNPFGGWQVIDWVPTPVDALAIEQPAADAWTITTWCLDDGTRSDGRCSARPIAAHFGADEDWSVTVPRLPASISVRRAGGMLEADALPSAGPGRLALEPAPDVSGGREVIHAAFERATAHYPRFRELGPYRLRATLGVLALLAIQELGFALVVPSGQPRRLLRWLSGPTWVVVGLWLTRVYLA